VTIAQGGVWWANLAKPSSTYVLQSGEWKLVVHQQTPIGA
jgi:hypothetical protein